MQVEIIGTDGKVHYTRPHDHPDVWEALNTPGYSVRGTGEKQASGSLQPACSVASCEWVKDEYGTKCGRPAKVRDTEHGLSYCERHGEVVSKAFGSVARLTPLNAEVRTLAIQLFEAAEAAKCKQPKEVWGEGHPRAWRDLPSESVEVWYAIASEAFRRTAKEILDQWEKVQADRAHCRECLERTGPGESPYTRAQEEAWNMREHCLSRTLLAAMPELAALLSSNSDYTTGRRT